MRTRLLTAFAASVLIALGFASSAGASVTLGQLAPVNPPSSCSGGTRDIVQPSVNSGNSYVVPATVAQGAITSWSHSAFNGGGQQITMKIWRLVSGDLYRVVGHDGPRTPDAGVVNTYSGFSIPVQAGDIL